MTLPPDASLAETLVDARGQRCPLPLIMTKQALNAVPQGAALHVRVDNETSCQNVERFLRDNGMTPQVSVGPAGGNDFSLRFVKVLPDLAAPDAAAYCVPARAPAAPGGSHVIALDSDTIGSDAALGRLLVQGLLETLKAIEPMPSHLILYSRAVLLAVEDATTLPALQAIAARGVAILLCGTCVDYFDKKAAVRVGEIANMLTLMEIQLAAGKVLKP